MAAAFDLLNPGRFHDGRAVNFPVFQQVIYFLLVWGERGARLNAIAPGVFVTRLAIDEFNGPRGEFYKNMFAKCSSGRPGTADEVANVAELLMSD